MAVAGAGMTDALRGTMTGGLLSGSISVWIENAQPAVLWLKDMRGFVLVASKALFAPSAGRLVGLGAEISQLVAS